MMQEMKALLKSLHNVTRSVEDLVGTDTVERELQHDIPSEAVKRPIEISTALELAAAKRQIEELRGYSKQMYPLFEIGRDIQARRMVKYFAEYHSIQEDDFVRAGNAAAHDANILADASLYKFSKTSLGDNMVDIDEFKFKALYGVSANETWDNRQFATFRRVADCKADMESWFKEGYVAQSVEGSFDHKYKTVTEYFKDCTGVISKKAFDENYDS
jgi:hypothetical protein